MISFKWTRDVNCSRILNQVQSVCIKSGHVQKCFQHMHDQEQLGYLYLFCILLKTAFFRAIPKRIWF